MVESTRRRADAARTIDVDLVTETVVEALAAAGVRTIVLKGPVLARLLYDHGELRAYNDVDLLIGEPDVERAGERLLALGFSPLVTEDALRGHRPVHAHEWTGPRGVSVDLHRTLPGVTVSRAEAFGVLSEHTVELRLGDHHIVALAPEAALLLVVLHAAHHGANARRPLADLDRALERGTAESWSEAAALAGRLGATAALGEGLRLSPAGARLADRLGLDAASPVDVVLRASAAPPLAVGLDWWLRLSWPDRIRLGLRTALPRPGALRLWRPLARRGPLGLAAAYASHPFWLVRHAIPSARAVGRARRASR